MSTLLFENRNVTISFIADKNYLLVKWNGFVKGDEFRKAAGEIIKAIQSTNCELVLSDNSDWKVISPNDHGWAAYNWFPKAETSGIRKLATVLSKDYFNRAAEQSIEAMAEVKCMEIRNFRTTPEAITWLTESKAVTNCV